MKKFIFLAFCLLWSFTCVSVCWPQTAGAPKSNPAQKAKLSPIEQELIRHAQQFAEADKNRDVDFFQRTLSEDFIEIAANGDPVVRDEVLEGVRMADIKQLRLYDFKVLLLNDGAAVVTYNEIVRDGGPRYQHLSTIWVKQGDQWKLKFQQSTPNLWSIGD